MTAVFATTAANNSRWFLTKHPRLEKGMRTAPNIILYSATGVANKWIIGNLGEVTCGYDPQALPGEFWVQNATGSPQTPFLGEAYGQWTADSEL